MLEVLACRECRTLVQAGGGVRTAAGVGLAAGPCPSTNCRRCARRCSVGGVPPCAREPGQRAARRRAARGAGCARRAGLGDALDGSTGLAGRAGRSSAGPLAARACALRTELDNLRTRMDERKWVDRAKGLLMSARGIGEGRSLRPAARRRHARQPAAGRGVALGHRGRAVGRRDQPRRAAAHALAAAGAPGGASCWPASTRSARGCCARSRPSGCSTTSIIWRPSNWARHGRAGAGRSAGAPGRGWPPRWRHARSACGPDRHRPARRDAARGRRNADRRRWKLSVRGARCASSTSAGGSACARSASPKTRCWRQCSSKALAHARLVPTMNEFEAALLELERAPLSTPEIRAMHW
jgi:hypothetical protein